MNDQSMRGVVFGGLAALFVLSLAVLGYGNYTSGMTLRFVLLNSVLLAIPLVLLYFCLGLMWVAWRQHGQGALSAGTARLLYGTPRSAGVVIALFVAMFALDAFDMPGSLLVKLGAFLLHALPSLIVLALLAVAWRWEWVGALVFGLAASLIFGLSVQSSVLMGLGNLLLFVLPMAAIALLFWLNWRWRAEIRHR